MKRRGRLLALKGVKRRKLLDITRNVDSVTRK